MIKLSIKNQKPLVKVGKRGHYTTQEKKELLDLPMDSNLSLQLRAVAAKFNRSFENVRRTYYRLHAEQKEAVDKEITKRESKMHKREVAHKFDPVANAWTEFEDELVIEAMSTSTNKKQTARELEEVMDRTIESILTRYYYLAKTGKTENKRNYEVNIPNSNICNEVVHTESKEAVSAPFFIPEKTTDLFLEEVSVTMYKSLDGSIHEKAQDAVKANIRFIIDSIPDKDVDDKTMHEWFVENKSKVEYLMNTSPNELW